MPGKQIGQCETLINCLVSGLPRIQALPSWTIEEEGT